MESARLLMARRLELDRWYKQVFRNGDTSYFFAERVLKNGNIQGTAFNVQVDRPRAKVKGKRESVWTPELWTEIAASEVPDHRFNKG